MSFNRDLDVDQFKTEHECDEHWELRRSFMLAHKDKFPEDRLVCLAQVFTNIEFLGCRYPAETMHLVASLSQGVADGYREKQKSRLQRTFVQASDAAGAKAKGLKRPLQAEGPLGATSSVQASSLSAQQQKKSTFSVDPKSVVTVDAHLQNNFISKSQGDLCKLAKVTYGPSIYPASQSQNSSFSPQSSDTANGSSRFGNSRYGGVKTYHIDQASARKSPETTGPEIGGPFGKLVIIEPANKTDGALQTIQRSTAMCQVPMHCKYKQHVSTEVLVDVDQRFRGHTASIIRAMSMKISVFWFVALYRLVDVDQRFRGHTASIIRAMSMRISVFWFVALCSLVDVNQRFRGHTANVISLDQTRQHYNPEDSHLHTHCRENLRSYYLLLR